MAQFVNAVGYNLWNWDKAHGTGGNLGWQYYHDRAWRGLIAYPDPDDEIKALFYDEL